ncbi:type II secretion system protein [Neptunomonas sp. XY-337]|uniref:pilus assembly FimT family protein n=1 Tax=Neptunomonas sp. XY-337 TaxID=2561897 RepID=UPI0010A9B728|nr:type II secretion system protein [Neptunomonas sp. XY-337]
MHKLRRHVAGFTMIELVTVLALLGILSAVAFSRLGNVGSYESSLFSNQLLAYLRLAQRTAVAHQQSDTLFILTRAADDAWQVELRFGAPQQTLRYGIESDITFNYAMAGINGQLDTGDTLTLRYTDEGDLARLESPAAADVTRSLALTVSGRALCISPTGFAYANTCL